jgi:tetratricopeptide (TPR) repeat protein
MIFFYKIESRSYLHFQNFSIFYNPFFILHSLRILHSFRLSVLFHVFNVTLCAIFILIPIKAIHTEILYPGRSTFEEAYMLEKKQPDRAIQLYRIALGQGLDAKMHGAARWRLFYLLKDQKRYGEALALLNQLGSGKSINKVADDLKEQMRGNWNIESPALDSYLKGLSALSSGKPVDGRNYNEWFLESIQLAKGNRDFRLEIFNRLIAAGRVEDTLKVMEGIGDNSVTERILRDDLLLRLGRMEEAYQDLRTLASSIESLSDENRYRILYLLGRIHRDKNEIYPAILYFRQSVRYAKGNEAYRQLALAAYALYRIGCNEQAGSLLQNFPDVDDEDVVLLKNIVAVDTRKDEESLKYLRKIKNRFHAKRSFLDDRALQLLHRYGEEDP